MSILERSQKWIVRNPKEDIFITINILQKENRGFRIQLLKSHKNCVLRYIWRLYKMEDNFLGGHMTKLGFWDYEDTAKSDVKEKMFILI